MTDKENLWAECPQGADSRARIREWRKYHHIINLGRTPMNYSPTQQQSIANYYAAILQLESTGVITDHHGDVLSAAMVDAIGDDGLEALGVA